MNGVTSRLDLAVAIGGGLLVAAGVAVWADLELAIAAGTAMVAVLVLGATCLRLSRVVAQQQQPADTPVGQRNTRTAPATTRLESLEHDHQGEELLSRSRELETQWQAAHRATTDFRRGLVSELALSFSDLQVRLAQLTSAVEGFMDVDNLVDCPEPEGGHQDPWRALVAAQLAAARKDIVGLKHEVRGIPRNNDLLHQVEAIVTLREMMRETPLPIPLSGGWRASPTTLLRYLELVGASGTPLVVECGSGVSSVWVGHRLRQLGAGRCVSLEHDPQFLAETRGLVRAHGLDDLVDIRFAPLSDEPAPWYDLSAISDLHDIDVLFVDGPPGPTAPQARAPALEALGPRMRVGGHILMDDSDREEEALVINGWLDTGLVRISESSTDYKGWTDLQYIGPQNARGE